MAKCGGFDKSGTEAATEWEAAKMGERMGLPARKLDRSGDLWIVRGSFDLDVKNVGLGLPRNRTRNDAGEAHLLTRKRPEKAMKAAAPVFQCGHEGRSICGNLQYRLFRDRKKTGHINLIGAGGKLEHIEVINFRRAGRGQSRAVRVGGSQLRGYGCALHGDQGGSGVAGFQPVTMVLDLGEVGVNRLHFRSLASEQGDANIQR